jgi:type I restriction enzyme, R subunit
LWLAYEAVEKSARDSSGGRKLADLISLVRHAINHSEPLETHATTVEERYEAWLTEQKSNGASFTPEQRRWLDAIKNVIANDLRIERESFDDPPLIQEGGLGGAYNAFGNDLPRILDELNERLAA